VPGFLDVGVEIAVCLAEEALDIVGTKQF